MIDLYKIRENCTYTNDKHNAGCRECPYSMPTEGKQQLCMIIVALSLLNKEPKKWDLEGYERLMVGDV